MRVVMKVDHLVHELIASSFGARAACTGRDLGADARPNGKQRVAP